MRIQLFKKHHNILLIVFILCNSCIDNNYSKTTSTIQKRVVSESGSYIDTLFSQDFFYPFYINHRKEIFILIQDSVILKNNINNGFDTLGKISCRYLFKDFVVTKRFFIFNFSDELNYDSCFVYSFPEFEFQYGLSDKIAISDNYLDDVVFLSNRLKYENYLDRLSNTNISSISIWDLHNKKAMINFPKSNTANLVDSCYIYKYNLPDIDNKSYSLNIEKFNFQNKKIDSFKAENCKGDFPMAFFKNNYLIESDDIVYLVDFQGVIQDKYKLPTGLYYYKYRVDKNIISFYGWLDTDKKLEKYFFVRYSIRLNGVESR